MTDVLEVLVDTVIIEPPKTPAPSVNGRPNPKAKKTEEEEGGPRCHDVRCRDTADQKGRGQSAAVLQRRMPHGAERANARGRRSPRGKRAARTTVQSFRSKRASIRSAWCLTATIL